MTVLDLLIKNFSKFPGIGKKSATRMAYYLLQADTSYNHDLSDLIRDLKEKIRTCNICGNYTEDEICSICSDPRRDKKLICVVEQSQDVQVIESTHEYFGMYHVLMGALSPIDGINPEDLTIGELIKRSGEEDVEEVIIATNPSVEGDTTALYLVKLLKERNVNVSRLASGLPVGGDLEYADRLTLARSLQGRTKM